LVETYPASFKGAPADGFPLIFHSARIPRTRMLSLVWSKYGDSIVEPAVETGSGYMWVHLEGK